jgi:signal transduction histidine kinase
VTSIGLYLDLLERGDEGRQPYYVQVLHKQKERLATLIEGIIKISRLHVMNTPTNFLTVNLNEVVGQLLETQTFHAQAVGLPLHFTPTSDLPAVKGDSQQLSDVIINLIGNAIQYTPTGEINVRTYFDDERVYLAVEDTGTGIGENELPYIFERFYRGEEIAQLNKPGIGLGLTIAREIITFHGGDIEVTSEPGEGSTFCVWLPRLQPSV